MHLPQRSLTMRPRFVLLLLIFFSITLSAKSNVDSLLRIVSTEKQDTNTVNALIEITNKLRSNYPDSAQVYAQVALEISNNLHFSKGTNQATYQLAVIYYFKGDYEKALEYIAINKKELLKNKDTRNKLASTLLVEGSVYKNMGSYSKAIEIYDECFDLAQSQKNNHLSVLVTNNKANIFRRQGKYNTALNVYLNALKICDDHNLESDKILVLGNIGLVYKEQNQYNKALTYHNQVLVYHQKKNNKRSIAIQLNNIGNIYSEQKKYNKALKAHQEAFKIREELGDLSNMASSMLNISSIYLKAFRDYDKALEYAKQSLTIKKEIKAKEGIADSHLTLADIYKEKKDFNKAIYHAEKGLEYVINIGELPLKSKGYFILSESYQGLNNHKKSLEYFKEGQIAKDSVFSKSNQQAINQLTEKYKFEKQEEQLARQQALLEKAKARRFLLIGIIFFLVALGIMSFYIIRQKQATNQRLQQLNNEVNTQNDELHLAQNRLKVANQDLQSFTRMASHDLKEPLRMMGSFSQLLRRRNKNLDESSQEYIEYITDAAQRMTRMLDDMLSYATNNIKIENLEYLNMTDLVDTVQKNLQFAIKEHNVTLTIEDNLPSFKGQASLIEQVFQNLIANGIKFSRKDVAPNINITTQTTDKHIIYNITDNGIGISPENKSRVFQLFQRLNKEYEGSGIGLATCKKIIELHDGEIGLESEMGKGTTFILTFPK